MRNLALLCALVVVDSASLSSLALRPVHRLRGGSDETGAESGSEPRVLTREEITQKLNAIPTFCVTNEQGQVAMMRMMGKGLSSKQTVCFFVDPEEAKMLLQAMQTAKPETKLKLSCHGLGTAFEHCRGWQTATKEAMSDAAANDDDSPEMRLMGSAPVVNHTAPALQEGLREAGMDPGCWTLPVFICQELQAKTIMPVFLSTTDIKDTWIKSGRAEADIPDNIQVIDLRMLVANMLTDDSNEWTRMHFISSPDAVALAMEVQPQPAGSAGE